MIPSNLIATVELLSDVHIGTGTELVKDIDWTASNDGYIYFANSDLLLDEVFRRAEADGMPMQQVANVLAGSTLADLVKMKWLTPADFGPQHPLFKYRLRGSPATVNIREQIKDVYGQPYLPGSTLKGALRTVLGVYAAGKVKPDLKKLDGRRSWAGQPIERQLFGSDPNHDLMRVLQVGDSEPAPAAQLRLRRAHIFPSASKTYRGRSRGLDVDIETLARGTVFKLPIHVPTELLGDRGTPFDERRRQELGRWEEQSAWLDRLATSGRENARLILQQEVAFYEKHTEVPAAHRFFQEVVDLFTKLGRTEFLAVLGWGGGWHTKTFNTLLKRDPTYFEQLVSRYNLNPTGTRKPGDPFPKSRHLLRINEQPGPPLGWVKVSLAIRK
jgi:CRISPR-associated protein Csm5